MIPKEIIEAHIIMSIDWISINGYPTTRKSKKYDLLFDGERYPPKYVISKAAEFSEFGRFLYHNEFNAVEAKNYLLRKDFDVVPKEGLNNAVVIDDLVKKRKLFSLQDIEEVAQKLSLLPKDYAKKLVEISNRRDTPMIKAIKDLYGYKCQMNGCVSVIEKKGGGFYCEVAHITPYSKTQTSHPDNLIVLCPNHHKEFDLGECEITSREKKSVKGILNRKKFHFILK